MKRAAGFTLVSAIFLMVVLVILAVSLVTISSVEHTSAAQGVQSMRAVYAARFGAEWAAARARALPAGSSCAAWPSPATLTPGSTLSGFTVTVTCTSSAHAVGLDALGATRTQMYYVVDITAQAGQYGTVDFVQRRVQTKVVGP